MSGPRLVHAEALPSAGLSRRSGGETLDVHQPVSPWTILPHVEMGYWTIARGWMVAPTLWPPRKAGGQRERERDHYLYVHLEVEGASKQLARRVAIASPPKAEAVLTQYRRAHGRAAWVFLPLRFAVGVDNHQVRIPIRGHLSKFLTLIGQSGWLAPDTLDTVIGWKFRVKVHTAATDHEQDEKPVQLRFTKAVKILEARPPSAAGDDGRID